MEKGIDKATERALEKYPLMSEDDKEGLEALKYIGMECECASVFNEVQEAKQSYFIDGYHQAEKDLELTWEDAKEIYCIALNLRDYVGSSVFGQPFYEEVLKQFKANKNVEQEV